MSPILVRPVREQLEHDRVIRLLQAKYKRKFDVAINPGNEQSAPVGPDRRPGIPTSSCRSAGASSSGWSKSKPPSRSTTSRRCRSGWPSAARSSTCTCRRRPSTAPAGSAATSASGGGNLGLPLDWRPAPVRPGPACRGRGQVVQARQARGEGARQTREGGGRQAGRERSEAADRQQAARPPDRCQERCGEERARRSPRSRRRRRPPARPGAQRPARAAPLRSLLSRRRDAARPEPSALPQGDPRQARVRNDVPDALVHRRRPAAVAHPVRLPWAFGPARRARAARAGHDAPSGSQLSRRRVRLEDRDGRAPDHRVGARRPAPAAAPGRGPTRGGQGRECGGTRGASGRTPASHSESVAAGHGRRARGVPDCSGTHSFANAWNAGRRKKCGARRF